jgi:hypothetical protein
MVEGLAPSETKEESYKAQPMEKMVVHLTGSRLIREQLGTSGFKEGESESNHLEN